MSADNGSTKRKKIVIIGAGFGGLRFLYDVRKQFKDEMETVGMMQEIDAPVSRRCPV